MIEADFEAVNSIRLSKSQADAMQAGHKQRYVKKLSLCSVASDKGLRKLHSLGMR